MELNQISGQELSATVIDSEQMFVLVGSFRIINQNLPKMHCGHSGYLHMCIPTKPKIQTNNRTNKSTSTGDALVGVDTGATSTDNKLAKLGDAIAVSNPKLSINHSL